MAKSAAKILQEQLEQIDTILSEAHGKVQDLFDEVDGKCGELSEKQAEGEKGQRLQQRRDSLEEVLGDLDSLRDNLNGIEWD